MRMPLTLALLWMTATCAFALSGTVKDAKGAAISGASLALVSDPSNKASTNANGEFSLATSTSVDPNSHQASHSGLTRLEVQGSQLLLRIELVELQLVPE